MQSIDQQAAASQTSGQPLSRNSRIQTPNSGGGGACSGNLHMNGDPASRGQFSGQDPACMAGSRHAAELAQQAGSAGQTQPTRLGLGPGWEPACRLGLRLETSLPGQFCGSSQTQPS